METRKNRELILAGLLFAMAMAVYAVYLDTIFRKLQEFQPLTNRELIVLGEPAQHQAEFIEKIARELAVKKDIQMTLGPPPFPRGRLAESALSYYILIEEDFFLGLSDIEQKALIGHEMGHIIFMPPNCKGYMSCQMGADLFAAIYTSPQAVIDLMGKLSGGPQWRESWEYKTRVEHLEKLKGKPLPSIENLLKFKRP